MAELLTLAAVEPRSDVGQWPTGWAKELARSPRRAPGLVTEAAPETPWGFCHGALRPGELVAARDEL